MKKNKLVAITLATSLALSGTGQVPNVQAKTVQSTMKLNATSKTVTVGKSVKLKATIVNKKKEKVSNIKWSVSKKGYIKLKSANKGKKLTIKGLKKGTVTVSAKVKIGKKSFTKKCKIKVAAKKKTTKPTATPKVTKKTSTKATAAPKVTKKPTATPKVTKKTTSAPTATPKVTKEPTLAPTATPEVTKEPTMAPTATPEVTKEPTMAPTATPEITVEPTIIPTETPDVTEELEPIVSLEPVTSPTVVTGTSVATEGSVTGTTGSAIDSTTGSAVDSTTGAAVTTSPEEVSKALKEWRTITDSEYSATQGFCTDGTDFYVAQQSTTQEVVIYRYSDKKSEPELFASRLHGLGHANDMTYGNGVLYVATGGGSTDTDKAGYGVIAFNMEGDVVGRYNFYTKDNEEIKPAGLEYDVERDVFYVKKGATVYVSKLDEETQELNAISSFKLNLDACTGWTYQGVSYYNNTIYVPVWNKENDHRESAILEYSVSDVVKANGTTKVSIEKKPSRITYYTYTNAKETMFEIEGVAFKEGIPYFVTNGTISTGKQSDRICYEGI